MRIFSTIMELLTIAIWRKFDDDSLLTHILHGGPRPGNQGTRTEYDEGIQATIANQA